MKTLPMALAALSLVLAAGAAQASQMNNPTVTARAAVPAGLTVTGTQTVASVGDCSRVDIHVTGEVTGTTDRGGGNDQIRVSL